MKHVVEVNDLNFADEVNGSAVPVLIDFSAPWCSPCKVIAPLVEKIARDRAGTVKVVHVSIEDAPEVSNRFSIRVAPTFVLLCGGAEVRRQTGALPERALIALLDAAD